MIIKTKNHQQITLSKFSLHDIYKLCTYLQGLSEATKSRFGPHPYDRKSITDFYHSPDLLMGYVAFDAGTNKIIAYAIIKIGFLQHDSHRLTDYGLKPDHATDCSFAPSVADDWQGMGIGTKLFHFILSDIKPKQIKRIILWGGVQAGNENAVKYYLNNGFKIAGYFNYQGENYDMVFEII